MMRTTLRRTSAASVAVLALTMGLAACGGDSSDDTSTGSDTTTSSSAPATSEAPSESTSESPSESAGGSTDIASQVFGPACSALPTDGAGSLNGMVQDPVATAASNNPLLKTLVSAVTEAGLVDTLNSAPALTVFAPTDDAFAKIPANQLKKVLADKATLTAILTHHVVEGQLDPDQVVGEHTTLNGDTVTVEGDAESGMTVDGAAAVLCGNIPTANATVYVIDSVLMPTN